MLGYVEMKSGGEDDSHLKHGTEVKVNLLATRSAQIPANRRAEGLHDQSILHVFALPSSLRVYNVHDLAWALAAPLLQFELVENIRFIALAASPEPACSHFLLHIAVVLLGLALFVFAHRIAAQV